MAKKLINEALEEEFPSNSKSARIVPIRDSRKIREEGVLIEDEKRESRPVVARAVRKKQSITQMIAKSFVGDETRNVGLYIINEVLVPAAKSLIQEMVTSGIEMMLFGETSGRNKSRDKDHGKSSISYGSFYKNRDRDDDDRRERRRPTSRDKFDLSEIYFRYGDEASDVLDSLCVLLEEYEQVTVADYFDLAGIDGATWAHNKYGWEDLRKAHCTHTRNGYTIILPDPIELD